jgi:hypothetical protein
MHRPGDFIVANANEATTAAPSIACRVYALFYNAMSRFFVSATSHSAANCLHQNNCVLLKTLRWDQVGSILMVVSEYFI